MTRNELGQIVAGKAKPFKGVQTGQLSYTFPNVGQATMFAQYITWDMQVTSDISGEGDLLDNPNVPTVVTVNR